MEAPYNSIIIIIIGIISLVLGISNNRCFGWGWINGYNGKFLFSDKTIRIINIIMGCILFFFGIYLLIKFIYT
jgi:threonine/homoserine/homoserine lactone efflux protein